MWGWLTAAFVISIVAPTVLNGAIKLAYLAFQRLLNWFHTKRATNKGLAVIVRQKLKKGDYRVIQGFFNQETNRLGAAQAYIAEKLDDSLVSAFGHKDLIVVQN